MPGNSWRRYPYNGRAYRSRWEVQTAQLLDALGLEWEYERFDGEARCFPDFYIVALDRFLEVHPDIWGPKRLPANAVLVKTPQDARAAVLSMGLRIAPETTKAYLASTDLARELDATLTYSTYLLQALLERESLRAAAGIPLRGPHQENAS